MIFEIKEQDNCFIVSSKYPVEEFKQDFEKMEGLYFEHLGGWVFPVEQLEQFQKYKKKVEEDIKSVADTGSLDEIYDLLSELLERIEILESSVEDLKVSVNNL